MGKRGGSAAVVKATVYDSEAKPTRLQPTAEDALAGLGFSTLEPPYDPASLYAMFERSSALRPNVDAYATNIDGFGYHLDPVIDLESADADKQVKMSLMLERAYDGLPPEVTDAEIVARRTEIAAASELERLQLDLFFTDPTPECSFGELRERTRIDLEVCGNAYWEVIRNRGLQIAQVHYAPSTAMRLVALPGEHQEVTLQRKISAVSYRSVKLRKRPRQYVQFIDGQLVAFFKELGDTRLMSAKTGRYYKSEAEMEERERGALPATEMIHFRLHTPTSAYGVPRWIGATLPVLGSRAADEVNILYFDNKGVPPLAVLVSGGVLAAGAADRIKNYIRDNIKGRDNFHAILVLEAGSGDRPPLAGSAPPRVQIEIKPLMDAQLKDALFLNYDERNTERVGGQFRLPKLLRGDVRDFNRATAEAAVRYAEMQVFAPERVKFDHLINTRLFSQMGIRFWRFVSNGPVDRDPQEIAKILSQLGEKYLTAEEVRPLLSHLLGKEFKPDGADWTKVPIDVYLAKLQYHAGLLHDAAAAGDAAAAAEAGAGAPPALNPKPNGVTNGAASARDLVGAIERLRDVLRSTAAIESSSEENLLRQTIRETDLPRRTVHVDPEEFKAWVVPDIAQ
jgi:PBSX family phage portal protein